MAKDDTRMNLDAEEKGSDAVDKNTASTDKNSSAQNKNTEAKKKNRKSTKQLAEENKKLTKSNKDLEKKIKLLSDRMDLLHIRGTRNSMTFSVLRSKILMFNFAIGITAGKVMNLVNAYGKQERAEKAVTQALRSTGFASGQTTASIIAMSKEIQEATGIGDEFVLQSASLLTTFTQIGGDVFPKAQQAIVDVAAAMYHGNVTGEALKTTTIQIGKALNEPIQGMSALRRVGIQFSAQQVRQITYFRHTNKMAEAQGVILKELNRQFGGMAKTILETTEGKLNALGAAMADMNERFGEAIVTMEILGYSFNDLIDDLTGVVKRTDAMDVSRIVTSFTMATMAVMALQKGLKAADIGLKTMAVTQGAFTTAMKVGTKAIWAQAVASKVLMAGVWGVAITVATVLIQKLMELAGWYNSNKDSILAQESALDKYTKKISEYTKAELEAEKARLKSGQAAKDLTAEIEAQKKKVEELEATTTTQVPRMKKVWDYNKPVGQGRITMEPMTDIKGDPIVDTVTTTAGSKEEIEEANKALADKQAALDSLNLTTEDYIKLVDDKLASALVSEAAAVQKTMDAWNKKTAVLKAYATAKTLVYNEYDKQGNLESSSAEKVRISTDAHRALTTEAHKLKLSVDELIATYPDLAVQIVETTHAEQNRKDMFALTDQVISDITAGQQADIQARLDAGDEAMNRELDAIKQTGEYKMAQKYGNTKRMDALEKKARDKNKTLKEKEFKNNQHLSAANVIIGYLTAVAKDAGKGGMVAAMISAPWAAAAAAAAVGAIYMQKMPAFAKGGDFVTSGPQPILVGDNPGGRERVQITPISSPNIAGPQNGGAINITFSGNVMSDEFIEEQAIPQIKEAIRRGADLGI